MVGKPRLLNPRDSYVSSIADDNGEDGENKDNI